MSEETLTVESATLPILQKALGETTFSKFEENPKGELKIHTGLNFRATKFKMRVGLHLGRPTQAIIAEGQFVKMRAAPEYADYELRVLDANNPDACLYEQLIAEVGPTKRWNPIRSLGSKIWGILRTNKVITDDPTS
jgi:hypothetical protein